MAQEVTIEEHVQHIDDELARLILTVAGMSVDIRNEFPHRLMGIAGTNKYGEVVAELDAWVNDYICKKLAATGLVRKIYSEELVQPMLVKEDAPFVVAMDPLDGSSNIVTNNPFGTIIGIYRKDLPVSGDNLAASLYKLYGPITTLVYDAGKGVHEFVKHRKGHAKYCLLNENMRVPSEGGVFGLGGEPLDWTPEFLGFAKSLVKVHGLKLRYCGAFVGDFSQILHKGGFFAYPSSVKSPKGKLRLFYEAQPMAKIFEDAGGATWSGSESLLQTKCDDVNVRTPLYFGSKELVELLKGVKTVAHKDGE
ncbi:fructose-1,6-bisphosphatase [Candidatus Micrarchaeota archaeon]|nr:fructose-1,6-bisphosphatase [Candidatus Micrarchaeota archaeon]